MNDQRNADNRKTGLYIHIPFCVKKCNYCAFLSFPAEDSPRAEYTEALIREIGMRSVRPAPMPDEAVRSRDRTGRIHLDTIYIGGGTPSVLDVSQLSRIMKAVRKYYDVDPDAEITLEANPGTLGKRDTVTMTKLIAYRSMGINRLSMGVQSMDNDRLHFMGRIHTPCDVERDFRIAREQGFDNINLDLIFSVPGETAEDALEDAHRIVALGPEHISCYSLQMEEGTPFYEMAERGEISEVSDGDDRDTYHRVCRLLRDAGYEHYEISNFARKGYRSRHNSLYWNMDEYIGCGLGSSGFVCGIRYRNTEDMETYLGYYSENGSSGEPPYEEIHINTPFDNISEAVFTGLRRHGGITYREALEAYGISDVENAYEEFWEVFGSARPEAEQYALQGMLVIGDEGLSLTESGIDISNGIMSLFV